MGFLAPIPPIILVLALALLVAGPLSLLAGRRGGRLRGLPGWVAFWCFFAALLVIVSRAHRWVAAPILAMFMFVGLRHYFFLTPVSPQDRWAIFAAYLSIAAVLWPAFVEDGGAFLVALPVLLFLLVPVLLSRGESKRGLLDSMGRVAFGLVIFVFCAAHPLVPAGHGEGRLELFGILAIAAELPQRVLDCNSNFNSHLIRSRNEITLPINLAKAGYYSSTPHEMLRGEGCWPPALRQKS